MAATVFNQAQLELLDMMQWVKSPEALAELKQVISDFLCQSNGMGIIILQGIAQNPGKFLQIILRLV